MSKAERKRRSRTGKGKRKSGVMRGMRGGFKNIAANVTGQEKKKKSSWVGTLITLLLIAAAGALLYNRFG